MPATDLFTGNLFSSDSTPGAFAFSPTGVRRIFSDGASDMLYRMVYTLAEPLTLGPGDYWFSHDTAVPEGMSSPVIIPQRAAASSGRPLPPGKIVLNR